MQRLRTRLRAGASTFPSATFALNFLTGGLDPAVTFTRSTTATFTGSNGLIQTAAINGPRFDYDPVTLAAKGLLIEEQRTNLFLQSETFESGTWGKVNATVTANASISPTGTLTADALVEDTTSGQHLAQQFVSFTSGTAYTLSLYVKAGTRSWVQVFLPSATFSGGRSSYYNLSGSGSLGTATGSPTSRTIDAVGGGWYRITITATATATAGGNVGIVAATADLGNVYAGVAGAEALYLWGAQLEAGAFATSYIPTVASQVTRSADVATITGTNFSSWYNQSEGSFVAVVDSGVPVVTSTYAAMSANDNSGSNRNNIFVFNGQWGGVTSVGGVDQASFLVPGSYTQNVVARMSYAYAANNFAFSVNGSAPSTDTSGSVPTVDRFFIGSSVSGGGVINGHIRQIAYYNTRLPNATLQALTA